MKTVPDSPAARRRQSASVLIGCPDTLFLLRPDRLGDVMLTLPAFALLKRHLPSVRCVALVSAYTADIVTACPFVDEVWPLPVIKGRGRVVDLSGLRRSGGNAASISFFSDWHNALALKRAGIPLRLAPATKPAQFLYTRRLRQRRSRSDRPEWRYNCDLAAYLLDVIGIQTMRRPPPGPYLHFPDQDWRRARVEFLRSLELEPTGRLVFVHPGGGGSSPKPSIEHFAQVCFALSGQGVQIIVTAGPGEEALADALKDRVTPFARTAVDYSTGSIVDSLKRMRFADLMISASTGPAHVASALGRPTATFYPRKATAGPLRWQTLAPCKYRWAFCPPETADPLDLSAIDYRAAGETLAGTLSGMPAEGLAPEQLADTEEADLD